MMLSVADVPFAGQSFVGCIGTLLVDGREKRIATYLGAKVEAIGDSGILIRQGNLTLQADLLESRPLGLRAPEGGAMTRVIRENPVCRVRYRCTVDGRVWFDCADGRASFESNWSGA